MNSNRTKNRHRSIFWRLLFFGVLIQVVSLAHLKAQMNMEGYLEQVRKNNPRLIEARHEMHVLKSALKVGLAPSNPEIEYGHFPSTNSSGGIKKVFAVSQSFEFPSNYIFRSHIAQGESDQAEMALKSLEQDVLLFAKEKWIEMVFLNKMELELKRRLVEIESLSNSFESKFEKGNTSILELNKARLQLVQVNNKCRLIEQEQLSTRKDMEWLCGTVLPMLTEDSYQAEVLIPDSTLHKQAFQNLAYYESIRMEQEIANQRLKLSKSEWLPEFSVGYESEKVADENFSGLKLGMSIPLWQNAHSVKEAEAKVQLSTVQLDLAEQELYNRQRQLIDKVLVLNKNLSDYQQALNSARNESLLNKALELGQISTIEYFLEVSYYFDIIDEMLELERDYYLALAELYQFNL